MYTAITAKDKSEGISDSWTVLVLRLQSKHESCSIHSITVSCTYISISHTVRLSCAAVGRLQAPAACWVSSERAPMRLVHYLTPQMAWNSHLMQYYLARRAAGSNNRPTLSQHVTRKATNYFGQQEANQKEATAFKCICHGNTVVGCRNEQL